MTRRPLRIAAAVGTLLLGAYGVLWWTAGSEPATPENFERIREGMTEEELEALLGASGKESWDRQDPEAGRWGRSLHWGGPGLGIFVEIEGGRVVSKQFFDPAEHGREGFLARLGHRLGIRR